jgi:hypothetical protein
MFSVVAAARSMQQQEEGVVLLCMASSTWVDRDWRSLDPSTSMAWRLRFVF